MAGRGGSVERRTLRGPFGFAFGVRIVESAVSSRPFRNSPRMLPRPRLFAACTLALRRGPRELPCGAQPADIDAIPVSQDYVLRTWTWRTACRTTMSMASRKRRTAISGGDMERDRALRRRAIHPVSHAKHSRPRNERMQRRPRRDRWLPMGGLFQWRPCALSGRDLRGEDSWRILAFPDAARSLAQDAKGAIWVGFVNPRVARCARGAVTDSRRLKASGRANFPS